MPVGIQRSNDATGEGPLLVERKIGGENELVSVGVAKTQVRL